MGYNCARRLWHRVWQNVVGAVGRIVVRVVGIHVGRLNCFWDAIGDTVWDKKGGRHLGPTFVTRFWMWFELLFKMR